MTVSHEKLGLLFILVGPTGAGKNSIMNNVLEHLDTLQQLPTATTRPIRDNEQEGREHHFVTTQTFEQMITDGKLLEWQEVHGKLYGMPRNTVENLIDNRTDRIADVDVLGALLARSLYPDNVVLIFVQPCTDTDDVERVVKERLHARGDKIDDIERRLERIGMEMELANRCDYLVINDFIEEATADVLAVIRAERSRRRLENLRVEQDQPRHALVQTAIALGIAGENALCRESTLPKSYIHRSELPQEAAVRALTPHALDNNASGQSPLAVTVQKHDYYEEICFWYRFNLDPNIQLADESWEWKPLKQLDLPAVVQDSLNTLSI